MSTEFIKSYDLRDHCNALLTALNKLIEKRSIIKLGIDIQLPNTYSTNPDELIHIIHSLADYLAKHLINGIINIELELHATTGSMITLSVRISGLGTSRTNVNDLDIELLIAGTRLDIRHKIKEDQINFVFNYTLSSIFTPIQKTKLAFEGSRVLLVEDNEVNALVFISFLEEWGCEVIVATNGVEAVALANDNAFDIILMDIHMPLMNGIEATRKIKENNISIPIIVLTASNHGEDVNEIMEAGACDLLFKPVSSANLNQILSKHL